MPHGFDSIIGERGVKLSGGQRQRIAIARAVLADPRILILDEATSNLDTQKRTPDPVQPAHPDAKPHQLRDAHRLSTITHADRIVVMENGRITETGTNDQLTTDGKYAAMIAMQN
ncbi:MAG: ATP-binding cassette domain-containing protein [Planctomycetaceae bacterium]